MDFFITGKDTNKLYLWEDLISNYFPLCNVKAANEKIERVDIETSELIIFLLDSTVENAIADIEHTLTFDVPVLCIMHEGAEHLPELQSLVERKGVRGLLDARKTSMNNLATAIHLVCNGGSYIAPLKTITEINN